MCWQVYYYVVDSPRNEGKDFFEINMQTGEVFTKIVFDREKQGAYALEVEARDGAPSARPNSGDQPNSGKWNSDFSKKKTLEWHNKSRHVTWFCVECVMLFVNNYVWIRNFVTLIEQ